jgi:hypothetical protein
MIIIIIIGDKKNGGPEGFRGYFPGKETQQKKRGDFADYPVHKIAPQCTMGI